MSGSKPLSSVVKAKEINYYIFTFSFQVFYRFIYNGDIKEGEEIAKNLISTCPSEPLLNNVEPVSYDIFQRSCDHLYEHGLFYYLHPGHFLESKCLVSCIVYVAVFKISKRFCYHQCLSSPNVHLAN